MYYELILILNRKLDESDLLRICFLEAILYLSKGLDKRGYSHDIFIFLHKNIC